MPDCNYCRELYESTDVYLDHLASEHEEELGPIDGVAWRIEKTVLRDSWSDYQQAHSCSR